MATEPGDETHRYGDYATFADALTASPGLPVKLNANVEADTINEGDTVLGIYYVDGENGTTCTVKMQGTVIAAVDSGVQAGDPLGSPNTSSTTPESDDVLGTFDDQGFVALEDASSAYDDSSVYHAEVLLR